MQNHKKRKKHNRNLEIKKMLKTKKCKITKMLENVKNGVWTLL